MHNHLETIQIVVLQSCSKIDAKKRKRLKSCKFKEKRDKNTTFLSSDKGNKGCFLALVAVGEMELKWRRFRSGSPVLPIRKPNKTLVPLYLTAVASIAETLDHTMQHAWIRNNRTTVYHENPNLAFISQQLPLNRKNPRWYYATRIGRKQSDYRLVWNPNLSRFCRSEYARNYGSQSLSLHFFSLYNSIVPLALRGVYDRGKRRLGREW